MHKPSEARDYLVAILMGMVTVSVLLVYLSFRRGYLFDAPSTADMWYVPNKAVVGAGTLMIAFTFLMGPLTRYFQKFSAWLRYRKEIGIVGGMLAVSHGLISLFLLPKKFPHAKMFEDPTEYIWGFIAMILLIFLFVISFRRMIEWIGSMRWWFLQRWGLRLVIIATVLHVVPMKWAGWVKWFSQGGGAASPELANPWMPGAGMLVSLFVAWVIFVRLYESVFLFRSFGFQTKEIASDQDLKARGRRFFLVSLWIMVLFYIIILTRWVGMA